MDRQKLLSRVAAASFFLAALISVFRPVLLSGGVARWALHGAFLIFSAGAMAAFGLKFFLGKKTWLDWVMGILLFLCALFCLFSPLLVPRLAAAFPFFFL